MLGYYPLFKFGRTITAIANIHIMNCRYPHTRNIVLLDVIPHKETYRYHRHYSAIPLVDFLYQLRFQVGFVLGRSRNHEWVMILVWSIDYTTSIWILPHGPGSLILSTEFAQSILYGSAPMSSIPLFDTVWHCYTLSNVFVSAQWYIAMLY